MPAPTIHDRQTAMDARCRELSSDAMSTVFGKTPYEWQLDTLVHLAKMKLPRSGVSPGAVLLVRPTGGGKSSVRDVHSVMNGGVSLTITPLLSLGADQENKINSIAKQTSGPVVAIHLDEY